MSAPNLQSILDVTARYYHQLPAAVRLHSRQNSLVRPRQVVIWLARKHTDYGLAEIGKFLDNRDHSTCCHNISQLQAVLNGPSGDVVQRQINEIEAELPGVNGASVPLQPPEPVKWTIEFEDRMNRRDPDPWMAKMLRVALKRYGFRARSVTKA